MRKLLVSVLLLGSLVILLSFQQQENTEEVKPKLETPYQKLVAVFTHPRCLNCHPSDGIPKQGDDAKPHQFNMQRSDSDKGFASLQCSTCHQDENNNYSGVPGAPHWQLAPTSMAWEGLTDTEIVKALLDKSKNGNRNFEELIHHLTEDELVLWAWEPGLNQNGEQRSIPPVSKQEYIQAVKEWFASGTPIPSN